MDKTNKKAVFPVILAAIIFVSLFLYSCSSNQLDEEINKSEEPKQETLQQPAESGDIKEHVETQSSETIPEPSNIQPLEKGVLPEAEEVPEQEETPEPANADPLE